MMHACKMLRVMCAVCSNTITEVSQGVTRNRNAGGGCFFRFVLHVRPRNGGRWAARCVCSLQQRLNTTSSNMIGAGGGTFLAWALAGKTISAFVPPSATSVSSSSSDRASDEKESETRQNMCVTCVYHVQQVDLPLCRGFTHHAPVARCIVIAMIPSAVAFSSQESA